jgi:glycosyltransferase involved in cell wall biosynthesis
MAVMNKEYFGDECPYILIPGGARKVRIVDSEQEQKGLQISNLHQGGNDKQLKAVAEYFPQVKEYLYKIIKHQTEADKFDSGQYWEQRYAQSGNSGAGSYGRLAEFKAEVLNDFVAKRDVKTVIEFGHGDGNQLSLAKYPNYIGYDVSETAVNTCRGKFSGDNTKEFKLLNDYKGEKAELVLSLDVIYHLIEDSVFENYMKTLFDASDKYVIVYASNKTGDQWIEHVKHRKFTDWVENKAKDFKLLQFIPNKYPTTGNGNDPNTSFADFYMFGNKTAIEQLPQPLISILVPIYNTEKHLRKCLDSILNQTYKNIEAICVNDCSPDSSPAILNEYAQKDKRIIVIDKTVNEGLPQARKTALERASGQYILPVDSDDWVEPNIIEQLYYQAAFGNYDMVCCGYFQEKDGRTYLDPPQILPEGKVERIKYGIFAIGNTKVVWNKLVKKEVYEKVNFGKESNGEDCFITCQNLYYADKVGYCPLYLYHWRYSDNSLTADKSIAQKRYEERKTNYEHIIEFCKEKFGNDLSVFEPELSKRMADIERQNTANLEESYGKRNFAIEPNVVLAYDIFIKNSRFDIIYKILYILSKKKTSGTQEFYRRVYLEHIRAFNNFYELEPPKYSPEAFVDSFDELIDSIETNGYNGMPIPIRANGNLANAAHRLACCVVKNIDVSVETVDYKHDFDWRYFERKGIDKSVADFGALKYVELNKNAHIVNVFPVISKEFDKKIESILGKYGFIYYRKEVQLNMNGCINLKKIHYGKERWIGNYQNKFDGLRKHAEKSMGDQQSPLRVYVFVCDNAEKLVMAKKEVRAILNIGNFPVHINDSREEAIELAQTYFNDNSIFVLNTRNYLYKNDNVNKLIEEFKSFIAQNNYDINDFCACGSTPLGVFGIREIHDFDFVHIPNKISPISKTSEISSHEFYLKHYPKTKTEMILNQENHFYFSGVKFITLDILKQMKQKRDELPKDRNDISLIEEFLSFDDNLIKIRFTNFWFQDFEQVKDEHRNIQIIAKKLFNITDQKFKIVNHNDPQIEIFSVYGDKRKLLESKALCKIFLTGENVNPTSITAYKAQYEGNCIDSVDLSMGFDYLETDNYVRFPNWYGYFFTLDSSKDEIRTILDKCKDNMQRTKFCTLIARHDRVSGLRTKIYNDVSPIARIDCPGKLFHNDDTLFSKYNDNKLAYLQQYKFNICPENSASDGYCTEKIFQSLLSGCIPIYNGGSKDPEPDIVNPNVIMWYDKLDEKNNKHTLREIKRLHEDDKYYHSFMERPFFLDTAVDKIYNTLHGVKNKLQNTLLQKGFLAMVQVNK